jgi:branched-chain amino acid aminotransferase
VDEAGVRPPGRLASEIVQAQFSASLASIDGAITLASEAKIPATDEGLLRGDGAFEVIRIYDGRPYALEKHLQRLERSALNLRLPLDLEAVRADANRLLAHAGVGPDHELLRIVITRGGRRLLLTEPLPAMPERTRLATVTYSPTRVLDGVKSLSYAANMLAGRVARERGADDALLVTPHGRVLEAPTSSIFWIADGQVRTPPLTEHILASITRALVVEQTGAGEHECTVEDLQAADEVFLASTVREVQPVVSIDQHSFSPESPLTTQIANDVGARIRAELSAA